MLDYKNMTLKEVKELMSQARTRMPEVREMAHERFAFTKSTAKTLSIPKLLFRLNTAITNEETHDIIAELASQPRNN